MKYYISKEVDYSFDEALLRAEVELKKEGFGVLTEIDVKATLKKKLDVDFRKYKILGACNPGFAHQALQKEKNIGVMLPCNLIVQENENGRVEIAAVNPMDAMAAVGNEELASIAAAVTEKLNKVVEAL